MKSEAAIFQRRELQNHPIPVGPGSAGHARGVRLRGLLGSPEVQVLLPGGPQAAGIAGGQVPPRRCLEEQRGAAQVRRRAGRESDGRHDSGNARSDDDREPMDDENLTPVDDAAAE